MGYVFNRDESVAGNVNRILAEQATAAIDSLENPGESKGESIHDVRKRIKKIRALFRLVRSELDKDVFQQANSQYRTIGQTLSHLRDATVMIKTLEKLREAKPNTISSRVFTTIRKALAQKEDHASREFFDDESNIRSVADALRQAPLAVPGLSEKHHSFSALSPNMKGIYRRGRKALTLATQESTIHNLHELRKEVKTIWYHTRLLEPIWPELFAAYKHEFGRLGELLGDDHDFGVLAQEIDSGRLLVRNAKTKETVLHLLHQQRTSLQEQIFPLANRLFAEKTRDFVGRYRLYWKLWWAEASQEHVSDNLQAA
ncbi:hypothetical protein BN8_01027 [Fibrisoma limi BUZ 3]|uniref:CHAD domain-containing protein n=1 Tax=Fibrisoma limi BUZ 3 TaxID=1185876 RepID=I2GDT0_9BACT|nr:CHAD domain-containing protein [Fibrisoma limi]CCH52054.1 hypothetical protein BN8_01027 [Fibrisoma limi BUZ 3]